MTDADNFNTYNSYKHEPVLLQESIAPFEKNDGSIYVDCTLGGGGHTQYLLAVKPRAKIFAFDRDPQMILRASERFREEIANDRLVLIHDNYKSIRTALAQYGVTGVDGILVDTGVSSYQLDIPERGFSFRKEGPLDMRMNPADPVSAADIVNSWSQSELEKIFFTYGEEKFSRKIVSRILERRGNMPITTTTQLAEIISHAIPKAKQERIHPATRVFQALRIVVNGELEGLEGLLKEVPSLLNPGGVFSAISFHSLEDRPIKEHLKFLTVNCICPPEIITCPRCNKPEGTLAQNKPIIASEEEIEKNPRSRSAKLRIFIKNK